MRVRVEGLPALVGLPRASSVPAAPPGLVVVEPEDAVALQLPLELIVAHVAVLL